MCLFLKNCQVLGLGWGKKAIISERKVVEGLFKALSGCSV